MTMPAISRVSDQCWTAVWNDTLIQLWGATTDASAVAEVSRIAQAFITQGHGPLVGLVYIEADSTPPDGAARAELAELATMLSDNLAALAYVYAGTGFRAAAIRSVMGAFLLVKSIGARLATRTFATSPEATAWLATRVPPRQPSSVDARRQVLEQLVEEFSQRLRSVRKEGRSTAVATVP